MGYTFRRSHLRGGRAPTSVTTVDVNNDGQRRPDRHESPDNTVSVLLGTASGTFGARTPTRRQRLIQVTTADV